MQNAQNITYSIKYAEKVWGKFYSKYSAIIGCLLDLSQRQLFPIYRACMLCI